MNRCWTSFRLGSLVFIGQILGVLGMIEPLYATLHQRLLHLGDPFEETVGLGCVD
jgi:hypothetical protein